MASAKGDSPLKSKLYHFDPEDINGADFVRSQENPAECINERIIDDVVSELGPAFETEGVPPSVLELLKALWIQKLSSKDPDPNESLDTSFRGYTDEELSQCSKPSDEALSPAEAPKAACLGARPKIKFTLATSVNGDAENIRQLDGTNDSSSDEEEVDNDDQDDDDDDDIDDDDDDGNDALSEDGDGDGAEDEPLGSGDDISDGDPSDLFNTENVVVCQYDKITRTRNKWKFHLKDGIMNLNGKDYVFQKATGEAECMMWSRQFMRFVSFFKIPKSSFVGKTYVAPFAAAAATFIFTEDEQARLEKPLPESPVSIPQSKMTTEFFIRQSSILSEEAASRLLQFVISSFDESVNLFLEANGEMANLYEMSTTYTLTELGEERLTELRMITQEKLSNIRDLELLFLYVKKLVEASSEVSFLVGEEFCSKQASEKLNSAVNHVQSKLEVVKAAEMDLLDAKKLHIENSKPPPSADEDEITSVDEIRD